MVVMLVEQQRLMLDREDKLRQVADKLREEAAEARGRAEMRAEMEKFREEAVDARVQAAVGQERQAAAQARFGATEAQLRDHQLTLLQSRLEALNAAKLLADEELFALEDAIADSVEASDGDDRTPRMVALSGRMAADAAFSRQLRRKFL